MRIVRPYGRSHVTENESGKNRRVLRLRSNRDESRDESKDIAEFAGSHDELIIAQWISAIDKIARKPFGDNGATGEQRGLRGRLGNAAWARLEKENLLPGLKDKKRKKHLETLWGMKVHPYGEEKNSHGKKKNNGKARAKGRWYKRFAGDVKPANVNAGEVARRIHEHLHEKEYRFRGDGKHGKGRIAHRAASISGNVLRPAMRLSNDAGWSNKDRETYANAGNVAKTIRCAAGKREKENNKVTGNIAAPALYKQYAQLFKGSDGKALSITEAQSSHPGLFTLHMAVKDCYSRILKHNRKKGRVSTLLPATMDELFALVEAKGRNRDLNALVRLGKVVHYETSTDIEGSRFWGSDGQAEIKRNEAFVRVWRHSLALAQRTLTDWADPEGKMGSDILGSIEQALGKNTFDPDKLNLLFGGRIDPDKKNPEFLKDILRFALEKTAQLRNHSFHFRGMDDFIAALTGLGDGLRADDRQRADKDKTPFAADVLAAIYRVWDTDFGGRAERLRKTLEAAHCAYFLDQDQNKKLLEALWNAKTGTLPLPRFNRILQRAENTYGKKGKGGLGLPTPPNRDKLEAHPARRCQYTALKLFYEHPFRAWIESRDADRINGFIDRAVERSTEAAKKNNAKNKKKAERELIRSRAELLPRLAKGKKLADFFFNLSAETASEMRVQRGYDSDAEQARKQAGYIEDLKCDVVARAFDAYLKEEQFEFLRELSADAQKPETPLCILDTIEMPKVRTDAENWQKALYFLIHLVPVDEIARLLHQIRKWEILAGKDKGGKGKVPLLQSVLELYLNMHDAKFEGGEGLSVLDEFKQLFVDGNSFDRVFKKQSGDDDDRRIPVRGLREIMRFGHLPVLLPVFKNHQITEKEVNAFLSAMEPGPDGKTPIAAHQKTREELHAEWVKEKKNFLGEDEKVRAYAEALRGIIRHRQAASRVLLTDHVRLHRLLMAVLGRLVDYSGLWERDLYFVTRALIHQAESKPECIFEEEKIACFENGQVVDGLRNFKECKTADKIKNELCRYFGPVWEKKNPAVRIRNNFAHFNMLRGQKPISLTACVNDARELMAYDRKLKNAVSQSVKELLHREGLGLEWTMNDDHCLGAPTIAPRQIKHLGNQQIVENLHGDAYADMAAALFCGGGAKRRNSIVNIDLDSMDWRSAQPGNPGGKGEKRRKRHRKGR